MLFYDKSIVRIDCPNFSDDWFVYFEVPFESKRAFYLIELFSLDENKPDLEADSTPCPQTLVPEVGLGFWLDYWTYKLFWIFGFGGIPWLIMLDLSNSLPFLLYSYKIVSSKLNTSPIIFIVVRAFSWTLI